MLSKDCFICTDLINTKIKETDGRKPAFEQGLAMHDGVHFRHAYKEAPNRKGNKEKSLWGEKGT